MVRGWRVTPLCGDTSIAQALNGDGSPKIAARIAFLEKAVRATDLESSCTEACFPPVRQETPNQLL